VRHIYVVTHPEATHHVEKIVGGWHDSVLTSRGRSTAAAIARSLRAEIPVGAEVELFSSDLLRASQTADAVSAVFDVAAILEPRLRGKSYGEAEGRPQQWLDERLIPPPVPGDRMNHDEGIPGSETRAAFARRVYAAMEGVLGHDCEHQIIVTHGEALTFVVSAWIEMPLESLGSVRFCAPSGSITTLRQHDFYGNRELVRLGEVPDSRRGSLLASGA
jgi:probable phosphoglycerate mutase